MDILVVLRAILYRLRQGCSWRTLSIFGHWETIYGHWRRWVDMGIWEQILAEFFMRAKGKLWGIDSTSCRVHKHAFGGVKGADYQDIGTSRGGSNTKIHALCDAKWSSPKKVDMDRTDRSVSLGVFSAFGSVD